MNILKFLEDYHIDHTTDHHHCSTGWVQVHCPLCPGNRNYHLGIRLDGERCNCWRCGGHLISPVIQHLLNCTVQEARNVIQKYEGPPLPASAPVLSEEKHTISKTKLCLPIGSQELSEQHTNYLVRRKFDPKKLIHEWDLKGTLFLGAYKFRIIAPIYFQGKLVSYQGRDITEKSPLRYKTCPKTLEILHHKHCLYGIDKAKSDYIVVTEGITDVWRLGPGAVATFGIQWNLEQAKLLMNYKRVFIMFDKQPQAKQQAEKLANFLALTSIEVHIITLDNSDDPAEMTQYEADKLMTDLCNNIF